MHWPCLRLSTVSLTRLLHGQRVKDFSSVNTEKPKGVRKATAITHQATSGDDHLPPLIHGKYPMPFRQGQPVASLRLSQKRVCHDEKSIRLLSNRREAGSNSRSEFTLTIHDIQPDY